MDKKNIDKIVVFIKITKLEIQEKTEVEVRDIKILHECYIGSERFRHTR